jgi:hypothetical protein
MTASRLARRLTKLEKMRSDLAEAEHLNMTVEELEVRLANKFCDMVAQHDPDRAAEMRTTLTPHDIVEGLRSALYATGQG